MSVSWTTTPAQARPGTPARQSSRRPTEYSAGGVMLDASQGRAVAIKRISRGGKPQWILPKGHIEFGETPREAAEREVREETGIAGRAGPPIGCISYEFHSGKRVIRKVVQHFILYMNGGQLSTADHEVSDVAWFDLDRLQHRLTHSDERMILRRAITILEESVDAAARLGEIDARPDERTNPMSR